MSRCWLDPVYSQGDIFPELIPTSSILNDMDALLLWVKDWNERVAPTLKAPAVRHLSEARAKKLRNQVLRYPNLWNEILKEEPHLAEKFRGSGWITFDFFLSENNLVKWLDGNYRGRNGAT